jgi:hypothetical protein
MTPSNATALALAVAACAATHAPHAEACAGCRNPSLAVSRGNQGPLPAGALRAGLSATGTSVHVVHEAGCADLASCEEVPVQPAHLHDQRLYPLELRLSAEYALNENVGIDLQLPFRIVTTSVEYTTLEGAPYEPIDEGVHHRDETLAGLGDPWLLFRAGGYVERFWLAARAGVSLPLGSTEEDPFELGDQGLRHQHIQFGSGTFDPIAILELARSFDGIVLQAFAQGQLPLYENRHGYHAPWRVYGGTSVGTLLVGKLFGSLGIEAFHEDAEEWSGERRQDGNLGRTDVVGAATLTHAFGATEATLGVRVPVYRHIVTGDEPPGTLSSPVTLSLGVVHTFGGAT